MALQNGFITLHRSLLRWGWHDDPATGWLFVNLLLMANYEPREWQGILIERGQLVTGRKALAAQTGLSEQTVRTALNHLKSTGEITIRSTNKFSLITVVGYGKYQDIPAASTSRSTSTSTIDQPADNHYGKKKNKTTRGSSALAAPAADDDLSAQVESYHRADDLIRRFALPDGDTTREALLEDAERCGFDALEDALTAASRNNSRQRVSINFYRRFLSGEASGGGGFIAIDN